MNAVDAIALVGAPRAVLVDEGAVGRPGTRVRALLAGLGVDVLTDVCHGATIARPWVAILSRDHPVVPDCYAWYVGSGTAPGWMHPTVGEGPATAEVILALLGTGFAQERAGAAFRAAGRGLPTPLTTRYDSAAILAGITAAVTRRAAPSPAATGQPDRERRALLLRTSLTALERCCAPNGAIAASPATSGDPDYWFFWQRDAAHAAYALHLLALYGPDEDVRTRARVRCNAWVGFVSALGPRLARTGDLAVSRCTMSGEPVGGYGDPQHDGPAATALVVLSVVADPQTALAVAAPYLLHLVADTAGRGFDLWELVRGRSFHSANLRRRALRLAARVALGSGDHRAQDYARASARTDDEMGAFRATTGPGLRHVLDPDPSWFALTSGLDMSAVGSALLAHDPSDDVLGVSDPDLGATLDQLTAWSADRGWQGVGRFPEDCNDGQGSTGGNPWPVATLWAAQFLLRRAAHPDGASPDADHACGLALLSCVLAGDTTALAEQMDGTTGASRGARPLAWSHAELVVTLLALDAFAQVGSGSITMAPDGHSSAHSPQPLQ